MASSSGARLMPVDFNKFVTFLTDSGDYWMFVVEGDDWRFVLSRIQEEFFPAEREGEEGFGMIFPSDNAAPVCWARRSRLPVEVVAARFGLTVEAVRAARMIHLRPLPEPPVQPTVDYYGEA